MTQPAPAFNLHALIREIADERGVVPNSPAERHAVAVEAIKRVPREFGTHVAVLTMTYFIQYAVAGWRARLRPVPPVPQPEAPPLPEMPPVPPVPPRDEVSERRSSRGGNANSANCNVDAVMRRVGRVLRNTTYSVVQGKSLDSYTAEDCALVAAYLEQKSHEYAIKAARYKAVIGHMNARGATVVRDLPAELLDEIFCHKLEHP